MAIETYWWMRARVIGCLKVPSPVGSGRLPRVLAARDAACGAPEQVAQLVVVEAGGARGADRVQERARRPRVRVVGRVQHLLGRDQVEEAEQVDRAPDGRVEEDARPAAEAPGQPGQVGDAGMGDDQLRARIVVDEAREVIRDGRQPAAAVDQDRDAPLRGEREHGRQPLVVQHEALGARMELDPARAEVEAALGLLDRALRQVEADERDQPALRALRVLERAVVRRAESRVAVGLVHAEHERAGHVVALHAPLELLVDPAHAVDVVPQVDVRVEDLAVGNEPTQLVVVARDQLLGPIELLLHESLILCTAR